MTQPLVFISYSHQDEHEKEQLLAHLKVLRQSGRIDLWSDDQIRAGSHRAEAISAAIAEAKVAILLLSANFFSADDLIEQVLPQLRTRQKQGELTILLVVAKACAWNAVDWLAKLEIFPPNHQPIWRGPDGHADEQLARLTIHLAETLGLPLEQIVPPELLGIATSASVNTSNLGGVTFSDIHDTNLTTGDISTEINTAGGDVVDGDKVSQNAQGQTIAQVAAGGTATINIYQQALQEREISPKDEPPAPGESPYKGLQYFDVADAELFFGREKLTAKLVSRLNAHNFLAVVGASGSGKSSLARAGLVAALQRGEPLAGDVQPPQDSQSWAYHLITPTAHPLKELAASLTRDSLSVDETRVLIKDLAKQSGNLDLAILRVLKKTSKSRLLLLVDQFEELFTLCKDETERQQFVDNLLTAVAEPDGPTTVVITLRADFYAHCGQYEQLRLLLEQQQVYIGPMSQDELQAAIEQPAKKGDWQLEPGLVNMLLDDVGHEPGALPLLSHALLATWQRRRGRTMTLTGYIESGRVQGAIAHTADQVYRELTPTQQLIARNIFLRLTEPGEGTQDTRRRATLVELIPNPELKPQMESVLNILADARLIATSSTTATDSETEPTQTNDTETAHAEVAHEALIREWPLLREWLDEDREALRTHRRLTEAAQEWDDHERHADYLYRGTRLERAEEWAKTAEDLNSLEQAFLQVSATERDRLTKERKETQQRELEAARKLAEEETARRQAETQRAEDQTRATRRIGWLAFGLSIVVIIAIGVALIAAGAAWLALDRQRAAEEQAELALVRQLAAQSLGISERNSAIETSLLLPLQAEHIRQQIDHPPILEVNNALRLALERSPLIILRHEGEVNDVSFSPDGSRLATASGDGTARLFDATTSEPLALLRHEDEVNQVSFSPDGFRLATRSDDDTVRLFDAATGDQLALLRHEDRVTQVSFSPDGSRLATASDDGTARLIDTATGDQLALLHHEGEVNQVSFSPDGFRLATRSGDGTVRLFDAATGDQLALLHHEASVTDVSFSPDGSRLATRSADGTVRLLDAATGDPLALLRHEDGVDEVSFSPDGSRLATRSDDDTVRLFDAATGDPLALHHHEASVTEVTFSPDGSRLATASDDGTARLFDVATGDQLALFHHEDGVWQVSFSPDGSRLATRSADGTARLFDVATGDQLALLRHGDWDSQISFSPDGFRLATSGDGTARLVDAATGDQLALLRYEDDVYASFSPDGSHLTTASANGTIRLFDATTGDQLALFRHEGLLNEVSFNPDGSRLAIAASSDDFVRLFDTTTGTEPAVLRHEDYVYQVSFSPDGSRLATTSDDGTARLFDAAAGDQLALLRHEDRVTQVSFSPDGSRLATAGDDGTARLIDTATGDQLALLRHEDRVTQVSFSPDGSRLITRSDDDTARLFDVATGDQLALLRHDPLAVLRHGDWVNQVSFNPDGSRLAITSDDNTARLFNATTGDDLALLRHEDRVTQVSFSPDGFRLATRSVDGTARLFDVATGDQLALLRHEGWVNQVKFSPDGSRLATAADDGTARLFDVTTGDELALLRHEDRVTQVSFSPDGSRLATISGDDTVRLLDATTGDQLALLRHEGEVNQLSFNPNGSRLATASDDDTVRLFDAATGDQLAILRHEDKVWQVSFSPDGSRLAIASFYGAVRLLDAATGVQLALLRHQGVFHHVSFSSDGSRLAIASFHGTVRLFDAATGDQLALFRHEGLLYDVSFSPDGSRLATAGNDHTARLWRVEMDELIDLACNILTRNLSQQEWNDYIGPERPYECTCPNLPPGEGVKRSCEGD